MWFLTPSHCINADCQLADVSLQEKVSLREMLVDDLVGAFPTEVQASSHG